MIYGITILIVLASLVLALFILIQAPKGGGLTGNLGSLSTQVMGVKQSTDVMEKGTWSAMGFIAALCLISVIFINKPGREARATTPERARSSAPAASGQQQAAPAPAPASANQAK